MKKNLLIMALLAVGVAACDNRPQYAMQPQPQYAQPAPVVAPAPVIVQAAPQHSGGGDMLTGALLGAAAGHLLTKNSQPAAPAPTRTVTRIVERRTVVNNYVSRPVVSRVTPSYSAARSVSAPSYSMARSSGGKR